MAKVNKSFDLITVKAKNFELPDGKITLEVSGKEIDTSLLARIMEPVYAYLNDYRKVAIGPAIQKYDKQIEGMSDKAEVDKLIKLVNDELKKLVKNLEKEAQNRIAASWKKIQKENKEYTKWKLKIGAKITWGVIKIGKSIAALVASAGAKADEYYKIAKSVYGIAKEVKKAVAKEAKLREDVMKAVEKMAKATKDGKVGKSHITKVEDTVKEYKVKLTAARQKASSMAKPLEQLLQLQDDGVALTKKQEKQINDMIVQIIEFNTTEKNGRAFADFALKKTKEAKGQLDLKTIKAHAEKVKKAIDIALKVFEVASDIL
ncbi:hypothetical protein AB838_04920 [Rhodobacteraceae bacterium (ex Bugula neritina AB1)]|nr:hypothetical protein AB838_04920 [Rhodobacteraceae bacterium (ex Bugula neritina AB1)]